MHQAGVGADGPEDVDAVDDGHHDVEQDHVGFFAFDQLECGGGVGGCDEVLIAFGLEMLADNFDVDRLVIHDDDFCQGAGIAHCIADSGGRVKCGRGIRLNSRLDGNGFRKATS